jgi:transcriptional regulator with GAF, ATPase, and Fis domain
MANFPSQARLAALGEAVNSIVPAAAFGFTRRMDDGRVSIFHIYPQGLGEWLVTDDLMPKLVAPSSDEAQQADLAALTLDPNGAFERFLSDNGVGRVLSMPVPRCAPARMWVATAGPAPLSADQVARLMQVADASHDVFTTDEEALVKQLHRLELAADVLPTLLGVLDLREVFDRLSMAAQPAMPHDSMVVILFDEPLTKFSVYARTETGTNIGPTLPLSYGAAAIRAWTFAIVHDHLAHPFERNTPATKMGARSSLRVPIRYGDRVIGGLAFMSYSTNRYASADVGVARRIADQVAIGLSHHEKSEEARHAATLRERERVASERAAELEGRVRSLTDELNARSGFRRVIGESKPWLDVLTQATKVAETPTTVLLLGESGTGKEVIARFLHRGSPRSNGPFIALNCAALPEQLLEAELFGYERGAFTGATQSKPGQLEQASGGTLFLDEVAEMSPSAQAKFLRVLQEREFQRLGGTRVQRTDTRVIAATNRDLTKDIANGKFREDLYYRLNVFAIQLPPLRERRDDVPILSDEFLIEIGRAIGRRPAGVSSEARKMLADYHWPGNVRELRNILERAAILCDGGMITPDHLAVRPAPPARSAPPPLPEPAAPPVAATADAAPKDLQSVERTMIAQALERARFNKSKAAKALGLTRHQLYIRMRKHGFD